MYRGDYEKEIKEFMIKYKNLLAKNDLEGFYLAVYEEVDGNEEYDDYLILSDITQVFHDLGVEPLKYMTKVPFAYWPEGEQIDTLKLPSNIKEIDVAAFEGITANTVDIRGIRSVENSAFAHSYIENIYLDADTEFGTEVFQSSHPEDKYIHIFGDITEEQAKALLDDLYLIDDECGIFINA